MRGTGCGSRIRDRVRHGARAGAATRADCRGRLRGRSAAARRALPRQCRRRGEPVVVAIFAGQHRERDAAFARQHREPLDAVFPPVEAAEQAHQDHLGMRADAIDPQIDRHRMAQVAQMREPHARQAARSTSQAAASPARSLSANDSTTMSPGGWPRSTGSTISSRLVELVVEQMHRSTRSSARVTAARSRPFSPITTRRPSRASAAVHGRSY